MTSIHPMHCLQAPGLQATRPISTVTLTDTGKPDSDGLQTLRPVSQGRHEGTCYYKDSLGLSMGSWAFLFQILLCIVPTCAA